MTFDEVAMSLILPGIGALIAAGVVLWLALRGS